MLFNPDFASEEAGFPVYETGLYQLQITDYKPFARMSSYDDGSPKEVGGVEYSLKMVGRFDEDGNLLDTDENDKIIKGKAAPRNTVWVHTAGGRAYSKPFLMAAHGYSIPEEEKANKELFTEKKLKFDGQMDTEGKELFDLGSTYTECVGNFINVYLVKIPSTRDNAMEGEMENEYKKWTPAK